MKQQIQWQGLPNIADTSIPAGISLLVDEEDALNPQLVAYLSGEIPPPVGASVQCGELLSTSAAYAESLFWHKSAENAAMSELPISTWLSEQQKRWPQWSSELWDQHAHGFALEPHLQIGKSLNQLSSGTLRKLWLAAALASGARIILVDQPQAGLDMASIRYLVQALDQWADQQSSHHLRWLLVFHFENLLDMQWDEVVEISATAARSANAL